MDLMDIQNCREKLIREKLGHKISCHDRSLCSRCIPILIRQAKYEDFNDGIAYECKYELEIAASFEVAYEVNHWLLKMESPKSLVRQSLSHENVGPKKKGKKREDGLYHMFITFTPDPKKDDNTTMVNKAERFIKLSGIKQYLYCYEYMKNIPIVHVHFYLKIDNIKHFGPKEILEFNGARVDVQHVISPDYVYNYINKPETKADGFSTVQSPNWKD